MSVTITQTVASTLRSAPIKVSLNVTSDTICPWCYIGFKQINNAIQRAKDNHLPITFDVEFSPFMLDPTLPSKGSRPRWDRYLEKFGEPRAKAIVQTLDKVGKELGINFTYDGNISQTIHSHRILTKAYNLGGQDAQQKLLAVIFRGFFEENKDVGDLDWLAGCAEQAGVMSAAEAKRFLESGELEKEVNAKIELAQLMGITGVPFTIVNGKWALSGAQPSDVFYAVFEKLAKEPKSKSHGKVADGATCEGEVCTATTSGAETCDV